MTNCPMTNDQSHFVTWPQTSVHGAGIQSTPAVLPVDVKKGDSTSVRIHHAHGAGRALNQTCASSSRIFRIQSLAMLDAE
jgi:hypothetical protein